MPSTSRPRRWDKGLQGRQAHQGRQGRQGILDHQGHQGVLDHQGRQGRDLPKDLRLNFRLSLLKDRVRAEASGQNTIFSCVREAGHLHLLGAQLPTEEVQNLALEAAVLGVEEVATDEDHLQGLTWVGQAPSGEA